MAWHAAPGIEALIASAGESIWRVIGIGVGCEWLDGCGTRAPVALLMSRGSTHPLRDCATFPGGISPASRPMHIRSSARHFRLVNARMRQLRSAIRAGSKCLRSPTAGRVTQSFSLPVNIMKQVGEKVGNVPTGALVGQRAEAGGQEQANGAPGVQSQAQGTVLLSTRAQSGGGATQLTATLALHAAPVSGSDGGDGWYRGGRSRIGR